MSLKIRRWRLFLAIREISNFLYIKRIIKREKKKGNVWNSFRLRADWAGRIYTVVNLRKEDLGDEEYVKRAKLLEKIVPINKYLKSLDIHEIVYPVIEKKTEQSYLLVYVPIFKNLTILYILRIMLILGGLGYITNLLFRYGIF